MNLYSVYSSMNVCEWIYIACRRCSVYRWHLHGIYIYYERLSISRHQCCNMRLTQISMIFTIFNMRSCCIFLLILLRIFHIIVCLLTSSTMHVVNFQCISHITSNLDWLGRFRQRWVWLWYDLCTLYTRTAIKDVIWRWFADESLRSCLFWCITLRLSWFFHAFRSLCRHFLLSRADINWQLFFKLFVQEVLERYLQFQVAPRRLRDSVEVFDFIRNDKDLMLDLLNFRQFSTSCEQFSTSFEQFPKSFELIQGFFYVKLIFVVERSWSESISEQEIGKTPKVNRFLIKNVL